MKNKAYFLTGAYLLSICTIKFTQDITVSDHKRGRKLMNEHKKKTSLLL